MALNIKHIYVVVNEQYRKLDLIKVLSSRQKSIQTIKLKYLMVLNLAFIVLRRKPYTRHVVVINSITWVIITDRPAKKLLVCKIL